VNLRFGIRVIRLVIEILVLVNNYCSCVALFQVPRKLSLFSMVCRIMCACKLQARFYSDLLLWYDEEYRSLLGNGFYGCNRVPDVKDSANDLSR
jgi:hypothetical protein